jgi:hypothetical protein
MNAEIIRFIARPNRDRRTSDFPVVVVRTVLQSGTSTTEESDTAPCEYVPSETSGPAVRSALWRKSMCIRIPGGISGAMQNCCQ